MFCRGVTAHNHLPGAPAALTSDYSERGHNDVGREDGCQFPVDAFFRPLCVSTQSHLHPWQRHDLNDFYPCAGHLHMGMILAEDLRGLVMRFGPHNRIAADRIFRI